MLEYRAITGTDAGSVLSACPGTHFDISEELPEKLTRHFTDIPLFGDVEPVAVGPVEDLTVPIAKKLKTLDVDGSIVLYGKKPLKTAITKVLGQVESTVMDIPKSDAERREWVLSVAKESEIEVHGTSIRELVSMIGDDGLAVRSVMDLARRSGVDVREVMSMHPADSEGNPWASVGAADQVLAGNPAKAVLLAQEPFAAISVATTRLINALAKAGGANAAQIGIGDGSWKNLPEIDPVKGEEALVVLLAGEYDSRDGADERVCVWALAKAARVIGGRP